jgi:peptide/nickel transport system permease protein
MIRFLLRRIIHAGILVFVTFTVTFFIIHLAPGDPLTRYYSPDIDPGAMDTVRHQLGLDDPLPVQFAKTLGSYARGDFGLSLSSHRPVSDIVGEAIPRTIQLTGLALLLQVLLGLGLGMLSAARRRGAIDKVLSSLFLFFYSLPSFYLAFILIAFFSLKLEWFPSASMSTLEVQGAGVLAILGDRLWHLTLPVSVLALGSTAAFARYARGSLLDVTGQEFVRTARAKGLAESAIMWKHVFKNALPPILTVVGLSIPFLLGGAVVVEKIFAWPGMGTLLVDSIYARDYPVVLAVNLIAAAMVVVGNLLADLAYLWVDPRIKRPADAKGSER